MTRWTFEARKDALLRAIELDREELRTFKKEMFNLCLVTLTASFGISAFLIGNGRTIDPQWARWSLVAADAALFLLLSALASSLWYSIRHARRCLTERERRLAVLPEVNDCDDGTFNPWMGIEGETRDGIGDRDTLWLAGASLGVLLLKTVALTIYVFFALG